MDTKKLAYFLRLHENGNITHTAKEAFLTQSALTKMIQGWEEEFHCIGRRAEAGQGDQHRAEAALPAVVGLGQGAGDNPQKQRDQQRHLILIPAKSHAAGQGDKYPHAVTELVQCPQATQGMLKAFR